MKQYCLKISSKNKKSLRNFLTFFFKHLKTKFDITQKISAIQNQKRIITLLKSPHVNKIAQEHFELRIFSKKVAFSSFYANKNIIFVKKLLNRIFHDISVTLELKTNSNKYHENQLLIFRPDNFQFNKKSLIKKNCKRTKHLANVKQKALNRSIFVDLCQFLNILSIFGELLVNSSLK